VKYLHKTNEAELLSIANQAYQKKVESLGTNWETVKDDTTQYTGRLRRDENTPLFMLMIDAEQEQYFISAGVNPVDMKETPQLPEEAAAP
jgi:hypothetical protein